MYFYMCVCVSVCACGVYMFGLSIFLKLIKVASFGRHKTKNQIVTMISNQSFIFIRNPNGCRNENACISMKMHAFSVKIH